MNEKIYDVLILGGGPAGLTAAIYAARADLQTLVLAGSPPGGQLMWTTEVENFPGFPKGIMGPELIENMRQQALRFGTVLKDENAKNIKGSYEEGFTVNTDSSNAYRAKSIILATGASAKWLEIESEQKLRGRGVSACATCDGFFFKGKNVAVVGGGDASMEEALFLTKFCPKVYLITRAPKENIRASKIMYQRALANSQIEFVYDSQVKEVVGESSVTGLKLNNLLNNEETTLDVQGVFIAIGHKPNTEFLNGLIETQTVGYAKTIDNTKTNIKGIFVAGDVADYRYRQAITAAGAGCMAALDVEKFLAEESF